MTPLDNSLRMLLAMRSHHKGFSGFKVT